MLPLVAFLSIFIFLSSYLRSFSKAAGISSGDLVKQAHSGFRNPYQADYLTFLILGLDQRSDGNSLLTDTILLVTINAKTGSYLLFSVPRDLWLDDLKTKINALYYYGKKNNSNDGANMVEEKLEEILDWKIDYTVILQMEDIKELIDVLGGVELEVERAFVDEEFPKDDGSGEMMTISFRAGKQFFKGEKALQFMRSRKSEDIVEGTDMARQTRQKKVILALKEKLVKTKIIWLNPKTIGNLYLFLVNEIETSPEIKLETLASFWRLGIKMAGGEQKEIEVPWQGEGELILIPSRDPIYNTWILQPENNSWQELRNFYHQNLP